MSELTREDVLQILELIDKAHYDFFELQAGDLRLIVNKTGLPSGGMAGLSAPPGGPAATGAPPASAPSQATGSMPSAPAAPPPPPAAPQAPTPPPVVADRTGLVPVFAPMVGTFYAQPEPGAPPFVQVGSHVDDESTMGLIEVMKVFTAIRTSAPGTVVEILVSNAEFVQYGQAIFYVRPD